jgi:RNA polymerase sigma-70 factor (ECF subfamily)
MDDKKILRLLWQRAEAAISALAEVYGKGLHRLAMNILHSHRDAEETVNDTYLGAWRSIPPHRPVRLSTYLGKITRRLALGKWKTDHAQKRGGGETALALEELGECLVHPETPEQTLELKELTKLLNSFIKSLPETEQRIFVCRYWHVYPVKIIAREFGFSESKVKSMLSRTRIKLKNHLEKEGIAL